MKFACSRCGSRHWPDPESFCPLCNDGREEPSEALGDTVEAQEQAIERACFMNPPPWDGAVPRALTFASITEKQTNRKQNNENTQKRQR